MVNDGPVITVLLPSQNQDLPDSHAFHGNPLVTTPQLKFLIEVSDYTTSFRMEWKGQGPSEFLLQPHERIITDVAKYAMSDILAGSGESRL
jgi:hypothetical protein